MSVSLFLNKVASLRPLLLSKKRLREFREIFKDTLKVFEEFKNKQKSV